MGSLVFEVRDAEGPQGYFWRVVDGDRILARSETMVSKQNAMDGARKVKEYAGTALLIFEYWQARNGKWDWHAKATRNSEIMITSTLYYATAEAAKAAAGYVERNSPSAVIIDRTRTAARW